MTRKRYRRGTHRTRSPAETWRTLENVIPSFGITRLADVTGLDTIGIPVFQAVRPASRNLSVSQGKGVTAAGARVSAAMEAIELWHAERLDGVPQTRMAIREMRSSNAFPLESLRWSPGVTVHGAVPVSWVRARSLSGGPDGWLPRQMIELDFTLGGAFEPRFFAMSSNGLASGNCPAEAAVHGLCERVERHALQLAARRPEERVALDPNSIATPYCRELVARIRGAGMKLAVYDVTWEARLPCVYARIASPELPHAWMGAGCHPSRDVALSRALTEAAQSRLTYIAGARDDIFAFEFHRPASWIFDGFVEPAAGRHFGELPDCATGTVAGDLQVVVARLAAAGFEAYWVDLTRAEIGIPVGVAFVPGLGEAHHA